MLTAYLFLDYFPDKGFKCRDRDRVFFLHFIWIENAAVVDATDTPEFLPRVVLTVRSYLLYRYFHFPVFSADGPGLLASVAGINSFYQENSLPSETKKKSPHPGLFVDDGK